ncbi:3-oxoacyl-ACP reductase FabG [Fusibacter paucivorans]|uniref:3-oxoacyl-ACP reductase FabG n=1 Tax=Fusibacter paucivorans TaxID=76009 RepID=A0ABS5PUK9_9FIRM|nr:3-oxoacyl-ACP reductase FabG [Fusibacter paucivorans]MBS7528776.1 3-oxoacyl-ACP reductase FabG [Fusibacter paucivorans]
MNKKTVLITGASKGIGSAIATQFASHDYNVVINYHTSYEEAKALSSLFDQRGYRHQLYQADITNKAEVDKMIAFCLKEYGAIDVLINNAGIAQSKLFTDLTEADWQNMINVSLNGMFYCTQGVLENMVSEKSGKIINISSIWGIVGASCEVHYSMVKAGIIGFTKALAKELGPSNIQVNCVAPGIIKTDMIASFTDEEIEEMTEMVPMGRLGTPEEIAACVFYLASDGSDYLTGQILSPNGGIVM